MDKRQVIVVGGGVGGSSAAFHLAKEGLDVLMLEKDQFPRDKPCGDGILGMLFPLLEEMGIADEIRANGFRTTGATRFYTGEEDYYRSPPSKPDEIPMYSVPRYKFDDIVNKAAVRSGIDYVENFEVTDLLMSRGKVKGVLGIHNGKTVEIESDLVVLASGSHFMPERRLGFYEEDPDYVFYGLRGYFNNIGNMEDIEFFYPDNFMPSGYIWIFPVSKTMGNVGVFITETALKKTGMTTEELLWDWSKNTKYGRERLSNATLVGKLKGWRLPTGMRQPIYADGVIAVGDAGNMIEEFGGGGIPQAMIAGTVAAKMARMAVDANDFSKEFLKQYVGMIDEAIGPFMQGMKLMRDYGASTPEQLRDLVEYMNANPQADTAAYLVQKSGMQAAASLSK